MWLPIAAVLTLLFSPELNVRPIDIAVFAVAIWGAYLVRTMPYWILGMSSFWTTRVGPIFQLMFTAELLLSGRLVPLSLMPHRCQSPAVVVPFKGAFRHPIADVLVPLYRAEPEGGT